ncbi:MAG TPA: DUF456 family protein [Thermoanaerobaculia bacterium]
MIENLIALLVMLAGLFIIPFGLPGLWLMIAVVAFGVFTGAVAWWTLALLIVLGIVAELLEFFAVKKLSDRHGGSTAAFWGAIAGGLIGAIIGAPIPIIGSFVAGVIGTFAGAALVTMYEQRDLSHGMRVGFGAALGRALAVAIKVAVAVVVLVVGMTALIL